MFSRIEFDFVGYRLIVIFVSFISGIYLKFVSDRDDLNCAGILIHNYCIVLDTVDIDADRYREINGAVSDIQFNVCGTSCFYACLGGGNGEFECYLINIGNNRTV